MLEPVGKYAESQSLGFRDRFVPSAPIGQHAGEVSDLTDPATVILAFELNRKVTHVEILALGEAPGIRRSKLSAAQPRQPHAKE